MSISEELNLDSAQSQQEWVSELVISYTVHLANVKEYPRQRSCLVQYPLQLIAKQMSILESRKSRRLWCQSQECIEARRVSYTITFEGIPDSNTND